MQAYYRCALAIGRLNEILVLHFEQTILQTKTKDLIKKIDDLKAGARIEISELKKDPLDFVLWKPSKLDEPGWSSPWGREDEKGIHYREMLPRV